MADHRGSRMFSVLDGHRTVHGLVIVSLLITGLLVVGGQGTGDTISVDTIDDNISVELSPASFSFEAAPGTRNFSEALEMTITNEGTENISALHAYTDVVSAVDTNPLGSTDPSDYAAGDFIMIRGNQTNSSFYHLGRLTWNNTERAGGKPSGVSTPEDNPSAWGFYRTAEERYLWSLSGNGSTTENSFCDVPVGNDTANGTMQTDNPALIVNNLSDTGSNRNLQINGTMYVFRDATDPWAVTKAEEGPLKGHYLAAHESCEKVYIYRYDARGMFPFSASSDHHLFEGTLRPNESVTVSLGLMVPGGIPEGRVQSLDIEIRATN